MKILVTGNTGSGKSTLGKILSDQYQIPLHGLDKVVWKENWQQTPTEERKRLIEEITSQESWIIEGVSNKAFQEADLIYFLNLPHYKCFLNVLKRFLKNGTKTRPELPNNCPEYIGVLKSLRISFLYEKITRPWILENIKDRNFVEIRSHSDLKEALNH